MKSKLSVPALATLTCVAMLTLGASGAAQAHDVDDIFWSIGMASPGIRIGVSNAPTVVVQPPIYVPQPVYVEQYPVYVERPVIYAPPVVYYGYPGRAYGHGRKHHGHHEDHDGYRDYGYGGGDRIVYGQRNFELQREGRREGHGQGHHGDNNDD